MKKELTKAQIALAVLSGVGVGFINGFLGAGGGMLVVPVLKFILKKEPKVAHATAVLVMLPICVVSGVSYLLNGHMDYNSLWQVAIGTFFGGLFGTVLMSKLRSSFVVVLFSVVMIGAGIFMIVSSVA